jgi:hypothetical protein
VLLLGGKSTSAQPLLAKYSTLEPKLYQVRAFVPLLRVRLRATHMSSTATLDNRQQPVNQWCFGRRTQRPTSNCIRRCLAACV